MTDKENSKTYTELPYRFKAISSEEMSERSCDFFKKMSNRRTIRTFSSQPIPEDIIENIIKTAASSPSGANKQPWTFCAISNTFLKHEIRVAAEKEEYESYHGRMSQDWLDDLKPIGTNWEKPFLEQAPWLIVVFKKVYDQDSSEKKTNYYVNESVGIACGLLIAAIHHAGLATVTHTPSPMNFLSKILSRPANERPFLLLPVGLAAENSQVPDIQRKPLSQVIRWHK